MCRNIKTLFNFDPPASDDEIRAASIQFIRKVSGSRNPSKVNAEAFDRAIDEVSEITKKLFDSLKSSVPPKNRDIEATKNKARLARRLGLKQA